MKPDTEKTTEIGQETDQPKSPRERARRSVGLPNYEYSLYEMLMGSPDLDPEHRYKMSEWPESLRALATERIKALGFCGEVVSDCVVDWIKGVRITESTPTPSQTDEAVEALREIRSMAEAAFLSDRVGAEVEALHDARAIADRVLSRLTQGKGGSDAL